MRCVCDVISVEQVEETDDGVYVSDQICTACGGGVLERLQWDRFNSDVTGDGITVEKIEIEDPRQPRDLLAMWEITHSNLVGAVAWFLHENNNKKMSETTALEFVQWSYQRLKRLREEVGDA